MTWPHTHTCAYAHRCVRQHMHTDVCANTPHPLAPSLAHAYTQANMHAYAHAHT